MEGLLDYCLRINHHASEHADLILHGIRPGIVEARLKCDDPAIALRAHWQHGPHILVGIQAKCPELQHRAAKMIREHALSWMLENPSVPIRDVAEYRRKSLALAQAEDIAFIWDGVRPTDTVGPADYGVPDFLGDPKLSAIRDDFAAAALDNVFDIVARRREHESLGLVRSAQVFLAIERLRGPAMLDFWPLSLQAQVRATRDSTPDVYARLEKAAAQLLPVLDCEISARSSARPEAPDASDLANWVSELARLQVQIATYVEHLDESYFHDLEASIVEKRKLATDAENLVPINILARSRTHFAYRIFMNMLYNIFPTVGFSAWKRILVACLVTRWLERNTPQVLQDAKVHAAKLMADTSRSA